MKNSQSLKFYKFLVDFSWYIGIGVCLVWLLVNLYTLFSEGTIQGADLIDFHLALNAPKIDVQSISKTYDFLVDRPTGLTANVSTFKTSQLPNVFTIVYFFELVTIVLLSFMQLSNLRKLLADVVKGEIFTAINARRLKWVGIIELIYIPVYFVFYFSMSAIIVRHQVFGAGFKYVADYRDIVNSLPHALEYLIFAGIFSFGFKLKQENDLTI